MGHNKKSMGWLVALSLSLVLTGCATLYDSMGLVAKDSMVTRDERLASIEAQTKGFSDQIDALSAAVAKSRIASEKFVEVEALLKKLEGRVGQLPEETLKRLSEILSQAVAESSPSQ